MVKYFLSYLCKVFTLSIIYLQVVCIVAFGEDLKPEWLTSASYKMTFAAWDKFNLNETYNVKYFVKTDSDLIFIAERSGVAKESSSVKVVFPDDFVLYGTSKKAWVDLNSKESVWEIYVNDKLMEDGKISFRRSRLIE